MKLNHWCQNPAPVPRTQVGINAPFLWQLELSKGTDGCENCNVTLSVRYAHWSRCHMKSRRQQLKKTPQSYLVLLHIASSITLFPQLLRPFLTSFVLFLPALLSLLASPSQICCHLLCCGLLCCYFGEEIVSYEHTCVVYVCFASESTDSQHSEQNPGINLGSVDEIVFFSWSLNCLTVLY